MSKSILKMIEDVAPTDKAVLDEIDARFWCWVHGNTFKRMVDEHDDHGFGIFETTGTASSGLYRIIKERQFTRSRDALKAIRPKEWYFSLFSPHPANTQKMYNCSISTLIENAKTLYTTHSARLPTEELAELHAIIQAIGYERNNKNNK